MINRFITRFSELRKKGEGAFVPFVNLCDPSQELSLEILRTLVENGADALELGIPFSDPCADGPVITESAGRALRHGSDTKKCLEVLAAFRKAYPDIPVSLMLYINLVYAPGVKEFFLQAKNAGADAVLIADLPISMRNNEWETAATAAEIDLIAIAPPNADEKKLRAIAKCSQSYTYLLSRPGITGTDKEVQFPIADEIKILRDSDAPALLLGFGISTPKHVVGAMKSGVDGVIVGSAIVKIITENLEDPQKMMNSLGAYTRAMKDSCKIADSKKN